MRNKKFSEKTKQIMLGYIEAHLDLYSEISCKELRITFGISTTMASELVAHYRTLNRLHTFNFGLSYTRSVLFKKHILKDRNSLEFINDVDLTYRQYAS